MIEAILQILVVTALSLAATMVCWSFALTMNGTADGEFIHFIRMFMGWFIIISVGAWI